MLLEVAIDVLDGANLLVNVSGRGTQSLRGHECKMLGRRHAELGVDAQTALLGPEAVSDALGTESELWTARFPLCLSWRRERH